MNDNVKIKYYTEEEKQIFMDKFVYKSNSCKKNYKEYTENLMNYHAQFYDTSSVQQLFELPYNTHEYLWSHEKNDNVVTHLTSQKKFSWSATMLKHLNLLHPKWDHINNEGNHVLINLAQNNAWRYFNDLNEYAKNLTDIPNDKNQYFSHFIFDNFYLHKNSNIGKRENVEELFMQLALMHEIMKDYNYQFINNENTEIIKHKWSEVKKGIKLILDEYVKNDIKFFTNEGMVYLNNQTSDIDKIFSYITLENTLHTESVPKKKMKI